MTTQTEANTEIEGLDDDVDVMGLGDYPIDTMMIRKETRTVFDVVRRINKGGFVLDPDFQRDFVWPVDKQSRLIESVLLRIPLPVFYLAEDQAGRTIVVDGLQRLTTFRRFLANELKLDLKHQESLHKKTFEELAPKLQNRVEDCSLELYVIDAQVPDRAKFDIFERVNGGVPLTRQQMRNCLYTGAATRWLKENVETKLFREATGSSLNSKTMRDREFGNRFCAFDLLGPEAYANGDMEQFLANALNKMNQLNEAELELLSDRFELSLENNLELLGEHAFRKHSPGQQRRSVVNASLWDVMSTGLAQYSRERVLSSKDAFYSVFYPLLEDPDFNDAITYSVNGNKKVRKRFEMANRMLKEAFGDWTN